MGEYKIQQAVNVVAELQAQVCPTHKPRLLEDRLQTASWTWTFISSINVWEASDSIEERSPCIPGGKEATVCLDM